MKCKDCYFWSKCREHEDYGLCCNDNNLDGNNSFDGDNAYPQEVYKHKNDNCGYFKIKVNHCETK